MRRRISAQIFQDWEKASRQPSVVAAPALMRGRDIHILAVFRDGAPGELDALRLKHRGELVVGERMTRIFVFDQLADLAFEHEQRRVGAFRAVGTFGEKETQLKNALGRVRILVGDGAAYGGRMDAYLFGDLFDHHRAQSFNSLVEEVLLAANDHFAGPQDRALTLRDIAHELESGAEALLHIFFNFFICAFGDQHPAIALAETQAGQVFLIHRDDPLTASLGEDDIGLNQACLFTVVETARARIEGTYEFDGHLRLGERDLESTSKIFQIAFLHEAQVAIRDLSRN